MNYRKPNLFFYRLTQFASWIIATFIFKRKVVRNEIKGVKGPFVVIANHECALDFVNLIGLNMRPMTFVISNSFYSTLPVKGIMDKIGVIPKQQFQTTTKNLKNIKAVIENGEPLVIYPAGLMCEDGLSTPIPQGTYKFLKWLAVDVYVAKITGSYFVMPRWSTGFNPGTTLIDVYKLFDKEELKALDVETVKERTREALLFNAYSDQDKFKFDYKKKGEILGLENVLYTCPNCDTEFNIIAKDKNTLSCTNCDYTVRSDKKYMLENVCGFGPEIRYVSEWNKNILRKVNENLLNGIDTEIVEETDILMINKGEKKFELVGSGVVTLNRENILLEGTILDEKKQIILRTANYPILPRFPGKYLELQDGDTIYRLQFKNGKMVQKFINTLKMYYRQINNITEELE